MREISRVSVFDEIRDGKDVYAVVFAKATVFRVAGMSVQEAVEITKRPNNEVLFWVNEDE